MRITAVVVAAGLLAGLTACSGPEGPPFDPCTVNPTYQAVDGSWREADGETLDADPCDADNFEVDIYGHVTSKKKKPKTPQPVLIPTNKGPAKPKKTK